MGSAASVLGRKKEIMSVDPVPSKKIKVFAKQIFHRYEWTTLKAFSQKYGIAQADLIRVFQAYLSHEEVYLRDFRVRTTDLKMKFLHQSKLQQELMDVFIPAVYLVGFKGLDLVEDSAEITFARFVILTYIFCMQQLPDLLYIFMAVLKQKQNLSIGTVIPYYTFQQLSLLLFEDLQPCGSLAAIKFCFNNIPEGTELRVRHIVRMAIKYPLLFYSVHRYRSIYRRYVFGDKFWKDRRFLKLKYIALADCKEDFHSHFANEKSARQRTALMLVADCIYAVTSRITLNDRFHPMPTRISAHDAIKVNSKFGYKIGKQIMLESELPFETDPLFLRDYCKTREIPLTPDGKSRAAEAAVARVHRTIPSRAREDGSLEEDDSLSLGSRSQISLEGHLQGMPFCDASVNSSLSSLGGISVEASVQMTAPPNSSAAGMMAISSDNTAPNADADGLALVAPHPAQEQGVEVSPPQPPLSSAEAPRSSISGQEAEPQTSMAAGGGEESSHHTGTGSLVSRVSQTLRQSTANIKDLVASVGSLIDLEDDNSMLNKSVNALTRALVGDEDESFSEGEDEDDKDEDEADELLRIAEERQRAVQKPPNAVIVHDDKFNRDFAYDVLSGYSRWDKLIFGANGRLIRQSFA